MLARLLSVAVIVALIVVSSAEPSWGPDGHEVTAAIAQSLLKPGVASQVATLLGGQSLAEVSTWADQVKTTAPYKWSAVLHYINTPDWACNYDYSRDCGDAICVSGAIKNYTSRLSNPSLSQDQRAEALKFLTHFIGDIHQPLHVAFTSDEGGNTIKGKFNGKSDNLHYIWDTPFPQMRISDEGGSQSSYSNYLIQQMQSTWNNNVSYWSSCSAGQVSCPDDWAAETIVYACTNAYVDQNGNEIQSGFNLGQAYYQFNIPVIDVQILKGGIRLAATLNRALGGSSTDDLPATGDSDMEADEARVELASNRFELMQRIAQSREFFAEDRAAVAAKLAEAQL